MTGRLAARFPNVPPLLAIVGSFVVCVAGLTLAEGLLDVAAVSLVFGYVAHSLFPAMDTYTLSSLPDRHRGSASALYSASMMVVQALGSGFVGTVVARGTSYTAVFQLSLAVGPVVVLLFALYRAGRLPAGDTPGETPLGTALPGSGQLGRGTGGSTGSPARVGVPRRSHPGRGRRGPTPDRPPVREPSAIPNGARRGRVATRDGRSGVDAGYPSVLCVPR